MGRNQEVCGVMRHLSEYQAANSTACWDSQDDPGSGETLSVNLYRHHWPLSPLPRLRICLVVVDRFSSFIRIVPLKQKFNTRDIVEALISQIYCYHGMPQEIISDRGPQFVFNYFTELHQAFGVHLSPSTAFHQQTNGSAERVIKTIAQVLRAYVNSKQTNWVS